MKYFLPSGPASPPPRWCRPTICQSWLKTGEPDEPGSVSVEYWTRSLNTADTLLSVKAIFFGPPCGCWMMLTKSLTVASARWPRFTKPYRSPGAPFTRTIA